MNHSTENPSVRYSVLVIGFRSMRFLEDCFGSLLKTRGPTHEILFLDNNSPEPEADWIEKHVEDSRIRVFRSEQNLFFAGGVNYLAERAQGEFLVLLNPDTRVEPDWLQVLDAYLRKTGYEAANLDLRDIRHPETPREKGVRMDPLGLIHHIPADEKNDGPYFSAGGGGMAIKRSVFFEVGAMDEDFEMYFEDTDLCWRVDLFGYRIGHAHDAIAYHVGGGSSVKTFFPWNHFRGWRNRIGSFLKNAGPSLLAFFIPFHFLLCLVSMLVNLLTGRLGKALAKGAAVAASIYLAKTMLSKRKSIQKQRKVTDGELIARGLIVLEFKHIGRPFDFILRNRKKRYTRE